MTAGDETESGKIVVRFTVTNSYECRFTPAAWADAMEYLDESLDPSDLDACYNRIERQDHMAEDWLAELASDRNWTDTQSAEIKDLQPEAVA